MKLYVYNTLTRKKEEFKPIHNDGAVRLYTCGPTVYWYATIGNFRTYVFSDILRRVLQYNGYKLMHVMNVTDVGHLVGDGDDGDDKMEVAAAKEHKTAQEIADYYLQVFKEDMEKLHILSPGAWLKASEHISEQIALIYRLEKKGYTYKTSDGIYFDSTKFKDYGKMARLNIQGLQKGKRVDIGEKKHKTDFALWKFSESPGKRQQEWKSPWGVGYPGWHIECSAMSMSALGENFDIHTGGEDHIPIHHTNEIAQSEAATGKKFVNYWLHGAFLTFKGEKVSKSKGGLYTLSELQKLGYRPEHYRYMCLLTHYRKKLDFSLKHLDAAKKAFERLYEKHIILSRIPIKEAVSASDAKVVALYVKSFNEAVNDDLNMPRAVQVMLKMLAEDESKINFLDKVKLVDSFDKVLGLGIREYQTDSVPWPLEIEKLINEREKAREEKNWKLADSIREKIRKKGYDIEDAGAGSVKLKRL